MRPPNWLDIKRNPAADTATSVGFIATIREIVHQCPPRGSGIMPCCGKTPFEVPRSDRMAVDSSLVTCAAPAPVDHAARASESEGS